MIIDLQQGSPEWLDYRMSKIMATDAATICGVNPFKTRWQLYQEKMGLVLPEPVNAKMLKGKELEPIALEDFNSAAIIDFKPAVIQSDQYPWMACSLDGATISSDNEIMEIVEIKCSKYCYDSISKQKDIPVNYRYQMNHQMLCCELDYCYYYAYWNGQGIIYCTNRDETIIKDILEKGYDFWKGLTNLEIPEGCNET